MSMMILTVSCVVIASATHLASLINARCEGAIPTSKTIDVASKIKRLAANTDSENGCTFHQDRQISFLMSEIKKHNVKII